MIEQVASAFERQDYRTAAELLKQLYKESPKDPWVQLYVGRLHEVKGKFADADKVYRRLLQKANNGKIVSQARQGLARLEAVAEEQRQQAIAAATADITDTEPGVLILAPLASEMKAIAAPKFAQIMQIDPYTARLTLPSRGWKLYRTGLVGELKYYTQQLQAAQIPCFWANLAQIQSLNVFQVSHFQEATPQPTVVCRNETNQLGAMSFDWSEVTARVMGLLPIFEEVVDNDARGNLLRKTQTQDYFHFCDLHLSERRSILRIYDNGYQFHEGIEISDVSQNTVRINWNNLLSLIETQIPDVPVWSDFTNFGETVLDHTDTLNQIQSHIHLFRREPTAWDRAFQLYSGLVFVKNG